MSFCHHIDTVTCPNCAPVLQPWTWYIPTVTIFPLGAPQQWTQDDDDTEDTTPPDPPKCEDCGGKGEIELFTGKVDCERCGGSGY